MMNYFKSPFFVLIAAVGVSALGVSSSVSAKDNPHFWDRIKTERLGFGADEKPFYFRAGVSQLKVDSNSSEVVLSDVGGPASLAIDNGPIEGSGVEVEDTTIASAIVGLRLGSGPWSLETILALPFTMEIKATGSLANEAIAPTALGNIPTGVPPLGEIFGETKVLPPIVTLVHRFRHQHRVRPYLGAGLVYLFTYDAKLTNPVLTEVAEPSLEVEDSLGYVLQAGMDIQFSKRWSLMLDVKQIKVDTSATLSNLYVATPDLPTYGEARVGNADIDLELSPWAYHIGIGFDF